jgi:hypothetical protein
MRLASGVGCLYDAKPALLCQHGGWRSLWRLGVSPLRSVVLLERYPTSWVAPESAFLSRRPGMVRGTIKPSSGRWFECRPRWCMNALLLEAGFLLGFVETDQAL